MLIKKGKSLMPENGLKIIIFDTTLRDGEQAPGASLNTEEKLEIAHQLAKLKVDVIEAGFPYSSQGDFDAVRTIAGKVEGPTIAALARAVKKDIDRAWDALQSAEKKRIHTFISTSDVQIEHQLKKTRSEVVEIAREMVARAKKYLDDVEFSPMDASRTDPEFLYEILEATINAGATTVNIPDTVGYSTPEEFGALIGGIKKNVGNIDKAVISVHCHNDLGLAVANSIEAVRHGARQVECTVNGIGERAGNTALEEIVMAIFTRGEALGVETGIDTSQIYKTSRMVSNLTGFIVPPNKAVVGSNAFAHESGIHQDGVLKERTTYEIMDPKTIGLTRSTLVLGKHSGRHALKARLEELGYTMSPEELDRAFVQFKELADKKKEVLDRDLEVIVAEGLRVAEEHYHLEQVQVSCGNQSLPTATVRLKDREGNMAEDAAIGTGPVDAVYKAINRIVNIPNQLTEFSVQSVTEGIDALGEVTIRIESDGKSYIGHGANTDIIVASTKAYINALNRLISNRGR